MFGMVFFEKFFWRSFRRIIGKSFIQNFFCNPIIILHQVAVPIKSIVISQFQKNYLRTEVSDQICESNVIETEKQHHILGTLYLKSLYRLSSVYYKTSQTSDNKSIPGTKTKVLRTVVRSIFMK